MSTRTQRRLQSLAKKTGDTQYHKRVLQGRALADVCPAYDFCLSQFIRSQEQKHSAETGADAAATSASQQQQQGWVPCAALVAGIKAKAAAGSQEQFQKMKLSRLLCTSVAAEFVKPLVAAGGNNNNNNNNTEQLPTRVSRIVAEQQDKEVLLHSVAAVVANTITGAAGPNSKKPRVVWLVNDEKTRTAASDLLTTVFAIDAADFCVLSTGSRKALDSTVVFGDKKQQKRDLLLVLTSPDATRANTMMRELFNTTLTAPGVAAGFSSLRAVVVASSADTANKVHLSTGSGATPPPSQMQSQAALEEESAPPSPIKSQQQQQQQQAAVSAPSTKTLYYAVVDGFGSFFALCRLIQNLQPGGKLVIHFATPQTATFFVEAFYALTNKSDSLFGQGAAGLTLICDAEECPKRSEVVPDGVFINSYEDAVRRHVEAAAKRFTDIPFGAGTRRAVYISGFGHVPALSNNNSNNAGGQGIFVQAETFPDLALSASALFQSAAAPFAAASSQYRNHIIFVSTNEKRHGMVDALREVVSGTTSSSAMQRRGREQQQEEDSTESGSKVAEHGVKCMWALQELPINSLVRGATDKNSNLTQVLEAREFQTLVRKMHGLTVSAFEAYRCLCLFYNTMAFGRHLGEVAVALEQMRPGLVKKQQQQQEEGSSATASLPFFGGKTAAWYRYLRQTALAAGKIAEHIDLQALTHRFGLESQPLLDLRTADTPYRPREDLHRFALSADTMQQRNFKQFADEKLPAERHHDEDVEYGGGWAEDSDNEEEKAE